MKKTDKGMERLVNDMVAALTAREDKNKFTNRLYTDQFERLFTALVQRIFVNRYPFAFGELLGQISMSKMEEMKQYFGEHRLENFRLNDMGTAIPLLTIHNDRKEEKKNDTK